MNKLTKTLGVIGVTAAAAIALTTEKLPLGRHLANFEVPEEVKDILNPDRKFDRSTLVGNLNSQAFEETNLHELSPEGYRSYRMPGLYEDRAKAIELLGTRLVELENGTITPQNQKDLQRFVTLFEAYNNARYSASFEIPPVSYEVKNALKAHKEGDTLGAINILREYRDAIREVKAEAEKLFAK